MILVPQPHLPRLTRSWGSNPESEIETVVAVQKNIEKMENTSRLKWGQDCNVETTSEFATLFWGWTEVVFESWNNVRVPTRKQHCSNVETSSFQPENNVETTSFQPENSVVSRLKSWIVSTIKNNPISTLFQRWNMTLFQCWSNVTLPAWRCLSELPSTFTNNDHEILLKYFPSSNDYRTGPRDYSTLYFRIHNIISNYHKWIILSDFVKCSFQL